MKSKTKKYLSQRSFMFIGLIVLLITMVAIFILSNSINKNNQETYKYITTKNFYQKLNSLQQEFNQIDDYLLALERLSKNTDTKDLRLKYEALNEINSPKDIIITNWYLLMDKDKNIQDYYIGSKNTLKKDDVFLNHIITTPIDSNKNSFIQHNGQYYWLMYDVYLLPDNRQLVYGITIDINLFHNYLTTIDVTAPNYAYIFTDTGLCIYHPEASLIGKNVFSLDNISPKDTLPPTKIKTPDVVKSEYLKLDVFRFVSPFRSNNFKGYITVNFPKFNVDDNIELIERNTILIFITTVCVIVFLFYLFNLATRKLYSEKEELAVENEKISKEKAQIQLQQLKNQINPHFLFNSLNSLYMLININPKTAQVFTLNLSKIYRYLITPPNNNIVDLEDELTFIDQFISLQKIRFKEEIRFEIIDNRSQGLQAKIPFLALQIVTENALKHNIATIETPLSIHITIDNELVKVVNNYQPKKVKAESELFGLNYLNTIYSYHNINNFYAARQNKNFVCELPLIKC
ncbi:histidine kinase [Myroides pelagicus]|nr:histidine kinase [Myroides pelagicus]